VCWADYFELGPPGTVLERFEFHSRRGPFLQSQPTVFNIPLCNIATIPLLRYMQLMTVLFLSTLSINRFAFINASALSVFPMELFMTLLQVGPWNPGSISGRGTNLSFLHRAQTGSGTHPASYPMGNAGSFAGGEAYHIAPSTAQAKNSWTVTE